MRRRYHRRQAVCGSCPLTGWALRFPRRVWLDLSGAGAVIREAPAGTVLAQGSRQTATPTRIALDPPPPAELLLDPGMDWHLAAPAGTAWSGWVYPAIDAGALASPLYAAEAAAEAKARAVLAERASYRASLTVDVLDLAALDGAWLGDGLQVERPAGSAAGPWTVDAITVTLTPQAATATVTAWRHLPVEAGP